MNDISDLIELVRSQLGLEVTEVDADTELDQLPGWDSVHLLHLLTVLEARTGQEISLPALLDASTLQGVFRAAVPT